MELSRRTFLGSSAAAVIAAGTVARGKVFGANDRIRMAVIGLHNRGRRHMEAFSKSPNSEVVALCDVDEHVLDARANELKSSTGKSAKKYTDMRRLFENKDVDAVSIATPNHWHSLATIWGIQHGKDVYVEKPMAHNVWEGRQVVNLVKKSDRVVQHGTQSRSMTSWIHAIQRLKQGVIGDIYMARALCFKRRDSIGIKPDGAPPAYLHWKLWQGPAVEHPYNPNYVHYNWHWFWLYGNGDIGNQGVHQMDIAIWGMNKGLPVRVFGGGGRYGYKDQGQTPNTLNCTFTYADGTETVFEVRGRATNNEDGVMIGNLFYGSDGYMVDRKFYDNHGKEIPDPEPPAKGPSAFENFLTAVRKRSPQKDVHGNAMNGFLASAHCALGNISYRTGRSLQFDPEKERFVNAPEADKLLTRIYRKGFEVPEIA